MTWLKQSTVGSIVCKCQSKGRTAVFEPGWYCLNDVSKIPTAITSNHLHQYGMYFVPIQLQYLSCLPIKTKRIHHVLINLDSFILHDMYSIIYVCSVCRHNIIHYYKGLYCDWTWSYHSRFMLCVSVPTSNRLIKDHK